MQINQASNFPVISRSGRTSADHLKPEMHIQLQEFRLARDTIQCNREFVLRLKS
jgi:hypothetical protein